jgi:hypothetical protein
VAATGEAAATFSPKETTKPNYEGEPGNSLPTLFPLLDAYHLPPTVAGHGIRGSDLCLSSEFLGANCEEAEHSRCFWRRHRNSEPERVHARAGGLSHSEHRPDCQRRHHVADGKTEDTGPLNVKRMETIDDETLSAG